MESPTNPRQHFDESGLTELAETIRKSGVFQAILARHKDDRLEIVFGARRYRASVLAGKETIPAYVREMTDAEVLEAQLVENLQRRDVHPMEEAGRYKRPLILAEPTYTVEQIAAKVHAGIARECAADGRNGLHDAHHNSDTAAGQRRYGSVETGAAGASL